MPRQRGFTLIELLVVFTIVATLLGIVAPRFLHQTDRAREAALRENLSSLRIAIDKYYADKGHYPEHLEQLVQERYLRRIPQDPVTQQTGTWQPVMISEQGQQEIYDVHSGAPGNGLDGTPYGSW